ncbi:MAG: 30S ribosomal protein S21 [Betaproteobacteria bacterium TMED156]|nr:MAG: 30S ribosomal protein S21 [Betaproteobacteria bacterium TMED156]|tara:strand:- start:73 stop:417 length:345 start_codon:yes stop_codon:yes gene_type:complete
MKTGKPRQKYDVKTFDIGYNKRDNKEGFNKRPRPPKLPGMAVAVVDNNVEKAMRKLKKMLLKEGVMQELRDRRYYMKPSFVKREDKKRAIRRAAKLRREQEMAEFGIIKKKTRR